MARKLSGRERLFLLCGAAMLVAYLGARPLLAKLSDFGPRSGRLLAEKAKVIAAYRQAVGRESSLTAETASLEAEIEAYERALLPGATPPLAAADLQTRLKQLADAAGLKIQSEKILAHVKRDAYLEIPVQIVTSGEIRNLKDFLVAAEASPTFIAIEDVSLRTVKRPQFNPATRTYSDASTIQANMTLVGLIRVDRD